MPDELRQVEAFLKASKIVVERQVMLEAKIVEVQCAMVFRVAWIGRYCAAAAVWSAPAEIPYCQRISHRLRHWCRMLVP